MIRKAISKICKTFFPGLWHKISIWRSIRINTKQWDKRVADVIACPDNTRLKRVENAGKIVNGFQVMHNGLKVMANGYYGIGITRMLTANLGCHEPQEEVVFDAIIRSLPEGSVMIEAGAYWGFYSMWFKKAIPTSKVFLIEPATENFQIGKRNFQENNFQGDFTNAYAGVKSGQHEDGTDIVSIQSFCKEKGLAHLDILHADVQGAEIELLLGAEPLINSNAIDYVFLSTHSNDLHDQCVNFLKIRGYRVLVSVNLDETYCFDGIIVACSPLIEPPSFEQPSRKF
jgi:hypothetical protein